MRSLVVGVVLCLGLVVVVGGCATSSESAQSDTLTAHVGQYGSPPSNLQLKRAAVPPFLDATNKGGGAVKNLGSLAADQLTTLLVNSNRFDVIERAQLDQLLPHFVPR